MKKKALKPKQLLDILLIGTEADPDTDDINNTSPIPSIEDYHILEKIGEAGQGQVWKAIQLSVLNDLTKPYID